MSNSCGEIISKSLVIQGGKSSSVSGFPLKLQIALGKNSALFWNHFLHEEPNSPAKTWLFACSLGTVIFGDLNNLNKFNIFTMNYGIECIIPLNMTVTVMEPVDQRHQQPSRVGGGGKLSAHTSRQKARSPVLPGVALSDSAKVPHGKAMARVP